MKKSLFLIAIAFVLTLAGGLALGHRLFSPSASRTVNADVILTALRDSGFLVTQTYVFDQPITITNSTGSAFKDFFFGQTITARGVMEVNLGVDLSEVSEDDVDVRGDIVTIRIPPARIFNVRPIGNIEVENRQGILKRLLQNDPGYNEALAELTRVAEDAARQPELVDRASERAQEEIARFLRYVVGGREVRVDIR